jgi:hypothetical protein
MQNSAIHVRCVVDDKENKHLPLVNHLTEMGLNINVIEHLELLSIYQPEAISTEEVNKFGKIIMQQNMGNAAHFVVSK